MFIQLPNKIYTRIYEINILRKGLSIMYGEYKELSGKDIIHLLEKFVGRLGNTSGDIIEDRIASGRRILTTETHRIIISQTGVTVIYTTEQGKTVTTVSFSIKTPNIIYKHIISGYKNGGSIMKSFINDEETYNCN